MPNTREKLIELLEQSLNNDGTGREMRFVGGDVVPAVLSAIANGICLEEKQATSDETSKWIPVTERLPEIYTQVLCFTGSSVQLAMYEGNDKWFTSYHSYTLEGKNLFTHWMPLPEPPKGE